MWDAFRDWSTYGSRERFPTLAGPCKSSPWMSPTRGWPAPALTRLEHLGSLARSCRQRPGPRQGPERTRGAGPYLYCRHRQWVGSPQGPEQSVVPRASAAPRSLTPGSRISKRLTKLATLGLHSTLVTDCRPTRHLKGSVTLGTQPGRNARHRRRAGEPEGADQNVRPRPPRHPGHRRRVGGT